MFSKFRKDCEKLVPNYASLLEIPPQGLADLALPCFSLAKEQKRPPQEIAIELVQNISIPKISLVDHIEAVGPYVNFFIDYSKFSPLVIKESSKLDYGKGKEKGRIAIESPGPNTNKPLHLGHIRNMVLGTSLSNILSFSGYQTTKVDIINDRGIHICKSMLAYQNLGQGKQPDKKPDHFIGDFYVLFAKELEGRLETDEALRNMLVAWEQGDPEVRALWKKMRLWALKGMKETYKRMGTHIDKAYYESDHYLQGKKIVQDGLKLGIFQKDVEGNIMVDLESHNLGKRVLLRPDGTTVYLTQDIALAPARYKDFKMDKMIYVVGVEQVEHFRALFKVFELLNYPFASQCYHLAYGMVNLPEGKMKSREGTVVDADNLMDETHQLAKEEIKKRDPTLPGKELEKRAEKIGLGAIKYYILKFDALKTITYDPKVSLSFEGDTGPYIMYTYARCKSILRKSKAKPQFSKLGNEEKNLVKKLAMFSEAVQHSAMEYKPHVIANYAFELASLLNEYYHSVKVINSDSEKERIALILSVSRVLKNCLNLLGIETLEKM